MTGQSLPYEYISSGVDSLDALIGAIPVGDNVVWEVDAGTSFDVFIRSFISRSYQDSQKVIYVSFNRSPQTVLNDLSGCIDPQHFVLVDCFTSGKGKNDKTFLKFYDRLPETPVVRIELPKDIAAFTTMLNSIEDRYPPGARYVFDSLTGMQDLWGDESDTHRFFTYMCPRLYDLETVAYWVLEKEAHSQKFKANLRHITQAVFDLSKRKNALFIKALKLEGRQSRDAFTPHQYEVRDGSVVVSLPRREPVSEVGGRVRETRMRLGISQRELADKVGLTPSFVSQLESNQVSPSLATFLLVCKALGVAPGTFLDSGAPQTASWLIRSADTLQAVPEREGDVRIYPLIRGDGVSALRAVFPPGAVLDRHFTRSKREELLIVESGSLSVTVEGRTETVGSGDLLHFRDALPVRWRNEGGDEAVVLALCRA